MNLKDYLNYTELHVSGTVTQKMAVFNGQTMQDLVNPLGIIYNWSGDTVINRLVDLLKSQYGTMKVSPAFFEDLTGVEAYRVGSYPATMISRTYYRYIQGVADALTAEIDYLNTTNMHTVETGTDTSTGNKVDTLNTKNTVTHDTAEAVNLNHTEEGSLVHGEVIEKNLNIQNGNNLTDRVDTSGTNTEVTTGSIAHAKGAGENTTTSKRTFDDSALSAVESNSTSTSGTDTDTYNNYTVTQSPSTTTTTTRTGTTSQTGTDTDKHTGTDTTTNKTTGTDTTTHTGTDITDNTGTVSTTTNDSINRNADSTVVGNTNADYLKIISDIYRSKEIEVTTFLLQKMVESICTGEYEF